jgi:hypothetical protein
MARKKRKKTRKTKTITVRGEWTPSGNAKFNVTLKRPITQRLADAIQKNPGYKGYAPYHARNEELLAIVFYFQGPAKKIKASHAKIKKLKSKNIKVSGVTPAR